jgi:hypothetical protein
MAEGVQRLAHVVPERRLSLTYPLPKKLRAVVDRLLGRKT